jgi:hypothetical protein
LSTKLAELDARVGAHDKQLAALVEAIRQLAVVEEPDHGRKIGFYQGNRQRSDLTEIKRYLPTGRAAHFG